jgi:predicted nucleic acid-binding protein
VKKRTNDKPFFDTNVLLYAFREDDKRNETARALLGQGGLTGVQALNEFTAVARRKLGMSWTDISQALAAIRILCPSPVPLTLETHENALRIAERYGYHVYDSLVIAAALKASCSLIYSEDMHDGQVIDSLTIRNPFRKIN